VVLYKHGEEKVVMRFKARNSDNKNWFSEANILESPWQDMLSATKNFFTIEGPCWPNGCRDFHINHFYTHCAVDNGWLSVGNEHGCEWERRFPLGVKLIYSKIATRAQYSNYSKLNSDYLLCTSSYDQRRTFELRNLVLNINTVEKSIVEFSKTVKFGYKIS
jgi:hypothetical protein